MTVELRGEWPGGIKADPNTGYPMFELDPTRTSTRDYMEAVRPVWACGLCDKKLKHTEAEHQALTGGATDGGNGPSG